MDEDIIISAPSELRKPRSAVICAPTLPAGAAIDDTRVITDNETVFVLQARLGSLRAWTHFLADCRQGKTDLHGYVLMPAGAMIDGRSRRPMYRVRDVVEFIRAIHALGVGIAPKRISPLSVRLNLMETDWRKRKFDTFGRPVAALGARVSSTFGRPLGACTAWVGAR